MSSPGCTALTRHVSASFARCELTHLARTSVDLALARRQHTAYVTALEECGCTVHSLAEAPELPDAVFVEDTAVVVDELAVMTRPGAAPRRPEVADVAAALARWRRLEFLRAPATLDGGDVLRVGSRLWVGLSSRTGRDGLEQLATALAPHGYEVGGVAVRGCLHLKSAVTALSDEVLLLNPAWVDAAAFPGFDTIAVDPAEPHAANALRIGQRVVYPRAFPRTAARLAARGFELVAVDVSELAKAEGAVTCCSLLMA